MLHDKHKCAIIDADKIAHEALKPGNEPYQNIVAYFEREHKNEKILNDDKTINREALGKKQFFAYIFGKVNWCLVIPVSRLQ